MSSKSYRWGLRLMRTQLRCLRSARSASFERTISLDSAFCAGGTLSSRSRMIASAPQSAALSIQPDLLPGMKRNERMGFTNWPSLLPVGPKEEAKSPLLLGGESRPPYHGRPALDIGLDRGGQTGRSALPGRHVGSGPALAHICVLQRGGEPTRHGPGIVRRCRAPDEAHDPRLGAR